MAVSIAPVVRAWPCLASAAMVLMAFPPINAAFMVFVALVPWIASLRNTDRDGAWRSGYMMGLLLGLGQLYWIGVLTTRWTGNWMVGALPWIVASLAFAVYFGWTGILIWKCWTRGWYGLIPLVWVGIEVFRSYVPVFAFPYGLIADPLWGYSAVVQSAHFGMVFLVSAWVLCANTFLALIIARRGAESMERLFLAFLLLLMISLGRYFWMPTGRGEKIAVTIAQPGVDMAFGDPGENWTQLQWTLDRFFKEAARDGTKLMVLPEGIADGRNMPPNTPFAVSDVPVLFGGRRGQNPTYQSAFGYDSGWKYVDKTRLVIFGEFVPGRKLFPFLTQMFRLPQGDMSAGTQGVKALELADIKVGPIICFEGMFPDIAFRQALNDSDLLAVISIDDWYMGTTAVAQLRATSVWRAIETGIPLVRSATLGHTMAVDGKGRVIAEAPLKIPVALRTEIELPARSSFTPIAPFFPLLSLVFAGALTFTPALPGGKTKKKKKKKKKKKGSAKRTTTTGVKPKRPKPSSDSASDGPRTPPETEPPPPEPPAEGPSPHAPQEP